MTFVLIKNPSFFYFSNDHKARKRDDEDAVFFFPSLLQGCMTYWKFKFSFEPIEYIQKNVHQRNGNY